MQRRRKRTLSSAGHLSAASSVHYTYVRELVKLEGGSTWSFPSFRAKSSSEIADSETDVLHFINGLKKCKMPSSYPEEYGRKRGSLWNVVA